ncbi:hypothetical protein MMPV_003777 [Pyropia vietnamensis]
MAAFVSAPAIGVGQPLTRDSSLVLASSLAGATPARAARLCRSSRRCRPVASLQSPDRDGPPDLEEYFAGKAAAAAAAAAGAAPAPPVSLGTGRANTAACGGNSVAAGEAAAAKALAALGDGATVADVAAVHVTADVGVDWTSVLAGVAGVVGTGGVPLIGRAVEKKDGAGSVEVLLLGGGGGVAIARSSVAVPVAGGGAAVVAAATAGGAEIQDAAAAAASSAAKEVLQRLAAAGGSVAAVPTFWLFASSGGAPAEAVRSGVEAATGGKAVVYGGPAAGDGRCVTGGVVPTVGSPPAVAVDLLGIIGGVSFIASAVVKTWAQPVFAEPLPYMTPTYTGDPSTDLLTAIRYNDMDMFSSCLDAGVDVNTQWADKQHQSPLLAACARARTVMVDVLLSRGADVSHRNDGGFTAVMYTRMLSGYDRPVVMGQLRALEAAGASVELNEEETAALDKATGGRIVPL